MIIGTQCYGLKRELNSDFTGTINEIHRIGYTAIEPLVSLKEKQGRTDKNIWSLELLSEAQKQMEKLGMIIPSIHIAWGMENFVSSSDRLIKGIQRIHAETGIDTYVFSGMFSGTAGAKKWAELLRFAADELRMSGCVILYHNHECEFKKIKAAGSMCALDYFFALAGENVKLQLDIGWAGFVSDEVAIARRYADKIVELHCKDIYREGLSGRYKRIFLPKHAFAPIGTGEIRIAEVLQMQSIFSCFNDVVIVDQDKSAGDMLKDLKIGYENLRVKA